MQYITLFASAFPLGAAVTFIFLYIEVRSDLFKLLTAYRRPLPMRQVGTRTTELEFHRTKNGQFENYNQRGTILITYVYMYRWYIRTSTTPSSQG